MATEELRKDAMMAHRPDALEAWQDVGHDRWLVSAAVSRHFMGEGESAS